MKTLLLLRHGKSSWTDTSLADHDRPLKKRGRKGAQLAGVRLSELMIVPDYVLTSSASRAVETTQLAVKSANYRGEVEVVSALYHADPAAFVEIVSRVPQRFDRVLIVGHNPGLEEWLTRLIGHVETLPTAALAWIELPIDGWLDLTPDTRGELKRLWRPKEIP